MLSLCFYLLVTTNSIVILWIDGFLTNLSTENVYKCGLCLIGVFIKYPVTESYPDNEAWLVK